VPYVNVRLTKDGVTAESKRRLIQGVTRVLQEVMGKDPQYTTVIIDEVDNDNWGLVGESVTERMKARGR
jgi:4-oxalocrotonate tautomerase